MSLRARIILLFATSLVATLAVASYLGERIASTAVERTLRDRALDVAKAIAEELALTPHSEAAAEEDPLAAALMRRRGVRYAELALRSGASVDVVRVTFGADGADTQVERGTQRAFALETAVALVEDAGVRSWRVDLPVADHAKHVYGALRLDLSLSEVERIAATERSMFFAVAGVGAAAFAVALALALGRMLARPLTALADAMRQAESGALDAVHVPGTARPDEVGVLARGLDSMLARIRSFNEELRERVDEAVADLARKNRELEEVNRLLVEARRDLTSKERLAALGQLSGTIAHELGNPLNTISGHVQLLARDPGSPPAVKAGLELVEREVRRMTDIIRRFLDSARALTPQPEAVDVHALIDEALSLSVPVDARARLDVRLEVAPDLGRVRVDPTLVRHVLTNLVSNAVDAMPRDGRLLVQAARRGDMLALSVADTGPGLGPEERKRVFEPFYTTKPRGKGTGLGLARTREIAGALHGRLEVESVPGEGSTFTLMVPAPDEPATAWGAADGAVARSRRR
jgi:two-component system NtrC family sensor kinase